MTREGAKEHTNNENINCKTVLHPHKVTYLLNVVKKLSHFYDKTPNNDITKERLVYYGDRYLRPIAIM